MQDPTRRQAVGLIGAGLSALAVGSIAEAAGDLPDGKAIPPVFGAIHAPKPLRFNPAKLTGLSERLLRSHRENSYVGSVRALNLIESRLAAAMADNDFRPQVYGGLKREELHRLGSVILHEHYFDSLGGDGLPAGRIAAAPQASYGSLDAWFANQDWEVIDSRFRKAQIGIV